MLKKNVKYALTAAINAVELTENLFFILCNTSENYYQCLHFMI